MSTRAITIERLTDLDPEDLRRLGGGYTSPARYEVRKTETPAHTAITLDLVPLETPYVREWPYDDEEVLNYARIVREDGLSMGAYHDGRLIALAIAEAHPWNRGLWVWELHVDPAYRRQGIGRRLLEALAEKGRAAGLRLMVCETQNTNVPAIAFYRRTGFTLDGIDLSYYAGCEDALSRDEVAIFMKRRL